MTQPAPTTTRGEVGRSHAHESAHLHVQGAAPYADDLPELQGTLHAALLLSPVAHGRLIGIDTERLRRLPGVVAVFTSADIPGTNDCGPILHDDPILADGVVQYLGQPVCAIVAETREAARRAARAGRDALQIEPLPAVLTAREAHAQQRYVVPPMHLVRESSPGAVRRAIDSAPHRHTMTFSLGGQEQFYLEGQIAVAQPVEDGALKVISSTQHPTEMQHVVAHALGLPAHRVQVECRRMGGGFGGKESQSALFCAVAALAAQRLQRPVKLRPDRDDDFMITGRRHSFEFEVEAGYDDDGRVLGAEFTLLTNAGFSTDLTPPVMTRAICHIDNAYWLPEVAIHGYCAKTHTQSNTAFRGFGGPQGALITEVLLDDIARQLQRDALAVRRANYYRPHTSGHAHTTPYGQRVEDNILEPLTQQLLDSSGYEARRQALARWNAHSPVLKRGIAFTPVKFGISFNVNHFNQAGALVHVYTDGSVLVNHGGTEMGQGLNTKVAQVVAHELGLPLARVRCTPTDTFRVANTSATAASTGADLNGKAAQDAARQIRRRLAAFWLQQLGRGHDDPDSVGFAGGELWCPAPSGAGEPTAPSARIGFDSLVQQAYVARIQLWSDGFYATPGLHWNRETLTGKPFFYFAYGAAVSEAVVDTLTGETRILRADLLHDAGRSLNPALDIGQVEGAYIQGLGWLTSEELVWHPKTGALLTHAPSTYKIPTANDAPPVFRTHLFNADNPADTVHRSKAVGEPPLLLAFSGFMAIRDAISAAGEHRQHPPLSAPATPEAVLRAIKAVQR